MEQTITVYAVRSKDGKYLRSKGYSGRGNCWVDDLVDAKIWLKSGGANTQVTWWATHYPDYGVPDLIPLIATAGEPINQEERVGKVLKKKKIRKLTNELHKLQHKYDYAVRENSRRNYQYSKVSIAEMQTKMDAFELEIEDLKKK